MKMFMYVGAAAFALISLGLPSQAQTVSVQLGGSTLNDPNDNSKPVGGYTAGVVAVNNWNVAPSLGAYVSETPVTSPTYTNLIDSTGATNGISSGVSFNLVSQGTYGGGGQLNAFASSPGDAKLFGPSTGALVSFDQSAGSPAILTISGLNASLSYDFYLYVVPTFQDGTINGSLITVGPDGDLGDATQGAYWSQTPHTQNSYVQGTAQTPAASLPANYIEFSGVTGSSTEVFTLYPSANNNTFNFEGFQFDQTAAVPEPSTAWLLAAAFLGLSIQGYRKRFAGV